MSEGDDGYEEPNVDSVWQTAHLWREIFTMGLTFILGLSLIGWAITALWRELT